MCKWVAWTQKLIYVCFMLESALA